jgi:hypothetical protein
MVAGGGKFRGMPRDSKPPFKFESEEIVRRLRKLDPQSVGEARVSILKD